jgi:predicted TIM-barrel enzyme
MKVFPVVHINDSAEAVFQASTALEFGADGVYLINHHGKDQLGDLFNTFNKLNYVKPDSFIGVNLLGVRPLAACIVMNRLHTDKTISRIPDGLWADNALTESQMGETLAYKKQVGGMDGLRYLGGISFKYTGTFTENPALASQLTSEALERVDVITTSGAGTGTPPTVAKITAMKNIADSAHKPLAVASGIDVGNVTNYQGIVDELLVASSVETEPYSGIFDQQKLQTLITLVHSL